MVVLARHRAALVATLAAVLTVLAGVPVAQADQLRCTPRSAIPWTSATLQGASVAIEMQVQPCIVRWTNRKGRDGKIRDRLKTWANVYWRPLDITQTKLPSGGRGLEYISLVVELRRHHASVARQMFCAGNLWTEINFKLGTSFRCETVAKDRLSPEDVAPGTGVGEFAAGATLRWKQRGRAPRGWTTSSSPPV